MLEGFSNPLFSVIFWYMLGMGGTYIFGAVLYGSRFPEKYSPGLYDYAVCFVPFLPIVVFIASAVSRLYCDRRALSLRRLDPNLHLSLESSLHLFVTNTSSYTSTFFTNSQTDFTSLLGGYSNWN